MQAKWKVIFEKDKLATVKVGKTSRFNTLSATLVYGKFPSGHAFCYAVRTYVY